MLFFSLTLVFAMGFSVTLAISRGRSSAEATMMAFPFGLGITTLLLWGLLSLKLQVSSERLLLLQALTTAGLIFYARNALDLAPSFQALKKIMPDFGWMVLLFLFAAGLVFNISFPIVVSDGLGYKVTGKLMMGEQLINVNSQWLPFSNQNRTLGFPLFSSYFYLFGFDHPKIVQSVFYISLLGVFYLAIRPFVNSSAAKGFTLLLATSPMVFWHSFLFLNNLSSGFYFFCGLIYWFNFLHFKDTRYLPIASLAFMLAAWMRIENLVFYLIPLASICFWSLSNRKFKAPLILLIFPTVFSVLWAFYSFSYFPGRNETPYYLFLSLLLIFLTILFLSAYANAIEVGLIWKAGAAILICGVVFLLTKPPLLEEIWKILIVAYAKFPIHVMNKVGWGSGIILVFFIPFFYFAFSTPQKYLLLNLILLLLSITILLSFWAKTSPVVGTSLWYKIEFFIQSIAIRISRSSNRMAFILIPSLFFLLGAAFCSDKATNRTAIFLRSLLVQRPYFNGLNVLVLANLIVIFHIFLLPRLEFLGSHLGDSKEKILQSSGPRDNHNFFKVTYKIAYAIERLTPPQSTIFMPYFYNALKPTKEKPGYLGIFATLDILYPRKVYWATGKGVKGKDIFPRGKLYEVTHPPWRENRCKFHPKGKPLGYHEWYLCPLNEKADS